MEYGAVSELKGPRPMMTEHWSMVLSEWITHGSTEGATVSVETVWRKNVSQYQPP